MLICHLYQIFKPVRLVGGGCRNQLFFTAVVVLLLLQALSVDALWWVLLWSPGGKVTHLQWLLCRGWLLSDLCWLRGRGHPLQAWRGNTTSICVIYSSMLPCGHLIASVLNAGHQGTYYNHSTWLIWCISHSLQSVYLGEMKKKIPAALWEGLFLSSVYFFAGEPLFEWHLKNKQTNKKQ